MSGGIDYSKWDNLSVSERSDGKESAAADDGGFTHMGGMVNDGGPIMMTNFPEISRELESSTREGCGPAERSLIERGVSYEKDANDGWLLAGPKKISAST